MLRRLITERRLDRGLWESASNEGKCTMIACGMPCFFCWAWMIGTIFVSCINIYYVLGLQSGRVMEVSCSEFPAPSSMEGLHHLSGCPLKRELVNNTHYIFKVGDFEWVPFGSCGSYSTKMKKGEFLRGSSVSFLGNATGGVLKPFIKQDARICQFMEGEVSAPIMMENVHYEITMGGVMGVMMCFIFLSWSSLCLFFPDSPERDFNSVSLRSMGIALLAGLMSMIGCTLSYVWGTAGFALGIVIIALVLFVGCDRNAASRMEECMHRPESEEDPIEDQPLLPQSSEPPAPVYSNAQPPSSPVQEQPAPSRVQEVLRRHEEVREARGGAKEGTAEGLIAAIAIGMAAGLTGGVLLSLILTYTLPSLT